MYVVFGVILWSWSLAQKYKYNEIDDVILRLGYIWAKVGLGLGLVRFGLGHYVRFHNSTDTLKF